MNRMSADYVICRKDFSIIAIIELDDASHNSESRMANDLKKDQAIKDSGLKIIRWHVNNMPDIEKNTVNCKTRNDPNAFRLAKKRSFRVKDGQVRYWRFDWPEEASRVSLDIAVT
ncbi:MAG: DUF2726 domain-containing protein [Methylovulum miyakonense]|uniref:DUF2726 domain-containing protein n=1 Tax=Methylovulum miyakonense TaxID=645578 RepID=UPI003BB5E5E8